MEHGDNAPKQRWWNEDTTLAEIAVWHAGNCDLTSKNYARYVFQLFSEGYDGTTLRQCGEKRVEMYPDFNPDLKTAIERAYDEICMTLLGEPGDDYYTDAQIATRVLDSLYSQPDGHNAPCHVLPSVARDLDLLSHRGASNSDQAAVFRLAAEGAKLLGGNHLCAVLESVAESPGYTRQLLEWRRFS